MLMGFIAAFLGWVYEGEDLSKLFTPIGISLVILGMCTKIIFSEDDENKD